MTDSFTKVYSQVKSIENKYLDLANYYKAPTSPHTEQHLINDILAHKSDLERSFQQLKLQSNPTEAFLPQCLEILSRSQNEMFKVATKHKVSAQFRNEALGLWYDAK